MRSIKVYKSDIFRLLNSLPPNINIPLKKDLTIAIGPEKIQEEIDSKTKIGKEYYLQLAEIVLKQKQNNTFNLHKNDEGIIL